MSGYAPTFTPLSPSSSNIRAGESMHDVTAEATNGSFDADLREIIPSIETLLSLNTDDLSKDECVGLIRQLRLAVCKCDSCRCKAIDLLDLKEASIQRLQAELQTLRGLDMNTDRDTDGEEQPVAADVDSRLNGVQDTRTTRQQASGIDVLGEIASLRTELAALNSSKAIVAAQYASLLEENQLLNTNMERIRNERKTVEDKHRARLQALTEELKMMKREKEENENRIIEKNAEISRLERTLDEMKRKYVETLKDKEFSKRNGGDVYDKDNVKSPTTVSSGVLTSEQLSRQTPQRASSVSLRDMNDSVNLFEKSLKHTDQLRVTIKGLRVKNSELEELLTSKNNTIADLTTAQKQVSEAAESAFSCAKKLTQEVSELKQELQTQKEKYDELSENSNNKQAKIEEQQTNIKTLKQKVKDLTSQVANIKNIYEKQRESAILWKTEAAKIKSDWARLGSTPDEIISALTSAKNKLKQLNESNTALKTQLKEKSQKINELENVNSEMEMTKTKITQVEEQSKQLQEKVREFENQIIVLKREKSESEVKIQELENISVERNELIQMLKEEKQKKASILNEKARTESTLIETKLLYEKTRKQINELKRSLICAASAINIGSDDTKPPALEQRLYSDSSVPFTRHRQAVQMQPETRASKRPGSLAPTTTTSLTKDALLVASLYSDSQM